jgi:hypothetical protein
LGSELLLAEQRQLSKQLILLQKADSGRDYAMVFGFPHKPLSLGGDFPRPSFSRTISPLLRGPDGPDRASPGISEAERGGSKDLRKQGKVTTCLQNRIAALQP